MGKKKGRRKKLPYREGTWFAVPLQDGGYAAGLVARMRKRGRGAVLFGYFFGPKRDRVPACEDVESYSARQALLAAIFSDLGLFEGEWPIICHTEEWDRSKWPMPWFGRVVVGGPNGPRVGFITRYSDDDPNEVVAEERCDVDEVKDYPKDGMSGSGAIEVRLTRLLRGDSRVKRPGNGWTEGKVGPVTP